MSYTSFYSNNLTRDYPFVEDSTGQAGAATVAELPKPSIVELGLVGGSQMYYDRTTYPAATLTGVSRDASNFTFTFTVLSDTIDFVVPASSAIYDVVTADSFDSPAGNADEPVLSGFLVVGDLTDLAAALSVGSSWGGSVQVETTRLRMSYQLRVRSVTANNGPRTREDPPDGCAAWLWPMDETETFWLQGTSEFTGMPISIAPGYNCALRQSDASNTITIIPAGSRGEGPAVPVALGADSLGVTEQYPTNGWQRFDAAMPCSAGVRSIEGAFGSHLVFVAGPGVTIEEDSVAGKIIIDVDFKTYQAGCL